MTFSPARQMVGASVSLMRTLRRKAAATPNGERSRFAAVPAGPKRLALETGWLGLLRAASTIAPFPGRRCRRVRPGLTSGSPLCVGAGSPREAASVSSRKGSTRRLHADKPPRAVARAARPNRYGPPRAVLRASLRCVSPAVPPKAAEEAERDSRQDHHGLRDRPGIRNLKTQVRSQEMRGRCGRSHGAFGVTCSPEAAIAPLLGERTRSEVTVSPPSLRPFDARRSLRLRRARGGPKRGNARV